MEQGKLISTDTTDMVVKEISVNGYPAELYLSQNPAQSSCIIWLDDTTGISFCMDAFTDESVLLHMAESVNLSEDTK